MLDKLEKWKERLNELDKERLKAEGRLEQSLDTLKDLGYASVEAAEERLEVVKACLKAAEDEALELLEKLEEKYGEYLSEKD